MLVEEKIRSDILEVVKQRKAQSGFTDTGHVHNCACSSIIHVEPSDDDDAPSDDDEPRGNDAVE
jgi:hypothetical protein